MTIKILEKFKNHHALAHRGIQYCVECCRIYSCAQTACRCGGRVTYYIYPTYKPEYYTEGALI